MSILENSNIIIGKKHIVLNVMFYGKEIIENYHYTKFNKNKVLDDVYKLRDYYYVFSCRSNVGIKHINIKHSNGKFYLCMAINKNGVVFNKKKIIKSINEYNDLLLEFITIVKDEMDLDIETTSILDSEYFDINKGKKYMLEKGYKEPFKIYEVKTNDNKSYVVIYDGSGQEINDYLYTFNINIKVITYIGDVTNPEVNKPSVLEYI